MGPRIVLQDSSMNQRLDPSGPSTPAPGREDGITRGYNLLRLMRPILTILTALHEREVPSNAPNELLNRSAPDLHAEKPSEVGNRGGCEDHGTVAKRPSEAPSEHILGDNHVGEDANDTGKSGRSMGECPCHGATLACIDSC